MVAAPDSHKFLNIREDMIRIFDTTVYHKKAIFMCMCLSVCVCKHVHVHTHTYTLVCMHTYMYNIPIPHVYDNM